MRKRRSKSESIKNLRDTGLLNVSILVFAPVACSKCCFETISYDIVFYGFLQQNFFMTIVDILFQNLGHHVGKVSKDLSEVASKKRTSHI